MLSAVDINSRNSGSQDFETTIQVASWNISAVNNNPFEYWATNPDPQYDLLMRNIQTFIDDPGKDLKIYQILSDSIFSELLEEMRMQGMNGLDKLEKLWLEEYRNRNAIQQFLKDKSIGTKRLVSMPDRITNTINLQDGGICLRPSVLNAYPGSLENIPMWWKQWRNFMFHTQVHVYSATENRVIEPQIICQLIPPILRGKYPAITEEEQSISVPLQITCLAALDAIFVFILNAVGPFVWQGIRRDLCDALITGKTPKVCHVLAEAYADCDVLFLQEAAAAFVRDACTHPSLNDRYFVLAPILHGTRDQNSLVLACRRRFRADSAVDVTNRIIAGLGGAWVAQGDLLAVSVADSAPGAASRRWLLASYHGDSNGLSSQPMVLAIIAAAQRDFDDHVFLLGLDANTKSSPDEAPNYAQTVAGFADFLRDQGLVSLWGRSPDPAAWTACSSRTYVQTQLSKAVPYHARFAGAQRSLKDWVVARERQVARVSHAARDTTGHRALADGTVLPTLAFPSDHAAISAVFHIRAAPRPPPRRAARCTTHALGRGTAGDRLASDCGSLGIASSATTTTPIASFGRTLYDYWGIGDKPPCIGSLRDEPASPDLEARGDSGLGWEEELRVAAATHFERLARGERGALDGRVDAAARAGDRTVWILFSRRPLTMAMRQARPPTHQTRRFTFCRVASVALGLSAARRFCTALTAQRLRSTPYVARKSTLYPTLLFAHAHRFTAMPLAAGSC